VTPDPPLSFDTFDLPDQTDLKVVADLLGVPYDAIQEMNPELRRGVSPASERYTIRIPKGMKKQFEAAYASLPADKRVQRVLIPADEIASTYRPGYRTKVVSYRVRRGDTLASIARRNGVSVKEIARLNRMSTRGELRKGQTVRIPKAVRTRRVRASRSRTRVGRYRARAAVRSRVSRARKPAKIKASRVRSSRRK